MKGYNEGHYTNWGLHAHTRYTTHAIHDTRLEYNWMATSKTNFAKAT